MPRIVTVSVKHTVTITSDSVTIFIAENGKQCVIPFKDNTAITVPCLSLLLYLQLVQITCSQQIDFLFFQYLDTFIQIAGANYHICNIVIGKRIHIFNKYTLV